MLPLGKKKSDAHIPVLFYFQFCIFVFLMFFFRGIWSIPSGKVRLWEQLELFSGAVCNMPAQRSVVSVISSEESPQPLLSDTTPSIAPIYLYQCHQPTAEDDGSVLLSGPINSVRLKSLVAPEHIALGRLFVAQWNNESRWGERHFSKKCHTNISLFYSDYGSCADRLGRNGVWRWGIFSSC